MSKFAYVLTLTVTLTMSARALAQGDTCAQATPITAPAVVMADSTGASSDGPDNPCNTFGFPARSTQWYSLSPTEPGEYVVAMSALVSGDPIVTAYVGLCNELVQLQCDAGDGAEIRFPATPGVTVLVSAGWFGLNPINRPYQLTVDFEPAGSGCTNPIDLPGASTFSGVYNNEQASSGPAGSCNSGASLLRRSQWFRFVPEYSGPFTITATELLGPDFTLSAILYESAIPGDCGSLVEIGCDIAVPQPATFTGTVTAGNEYVLQVGDASSVTGGGNYSLNLQLPGPPVGTSCSGAIDLGTLRDDFSGTYTNLNNPSGFIRPSCNPSLVNVLNSQWLTFTPDFDGPVTVSLSSVGSWTAVGALYGGTCTNRIELDCVAEPQTISLQTTGVAGEPLYILVSQFGITPGGGEYTLSIDVNEPPPEGEACGDPIDLTLTDGAFAGEFTNEFNPDTLSFSLTCRPPGPTAPGKQQWFQLVAPEGGIYTLTIDPIGGWAPVVAAFDGICSFLVPVDCGVGPGPIVLEIGLGTGQDILLLVQGEGADNNGQYDLTIDLQPVAPTGPTCDDAIPLDLSIGAFTGEFNNSFNPGDSTILSCNSNFATGTENAQWFSFTPSSTGQLTVTISEDIDRFDIIAAIMTGSCASPNELVCGDNPEPILIQTHVTAGVPMYVLVGDWGTLPGGGPYTLDITIVSDCPADLSGDGVLNNTDINLFVSAFLAMDPAADFNDDSNFNNTDINAFVNAFLAGCD